jgi:GTP-binding protein
MAAATELPVIVIVGRPNVGKSTLFNAILGQRRSIVGDEPGITRDRIHGEVDWHGRRFELIDTGGIIPDDEALIPSEILRQARHALEKAAHIVFLIDGRTEITSADRDLAQILRRFSKPVSLAVNKVDHPSREGLTLNFHELGFADVFAVSAEHRLGLTELLDHVTAHLPAHATDPAEPAGVPKSAIRVAIVGRPNTGKSTLLNALTGRDRAIVSPVAGTTRDAVDEKVTVNGREFVFVDTAGIRRKGKTKLMAEKLSVVMARKHIERADVVIVLIDATEGATAQDAHVAGYAHEAAKPVVICVNKWDAVAAKDRKRFEQNVRDELKFLDYAPVVFASARTGHSVERLFPLVEQAYEGARQRVTTGELNRFVDFLKAETDVKLLYATQAGVAPPTFVVFSDARELHFSTERFLTNQLRKRFGFKGTPLVIKAKYRHEKKKGQR